MNYVCIANGVQNRKLVPADDDIWKYIDPKRDCYRSIFYYNDEHYKHWKKEGNLAGITGLYTDKLVWDFDDKNNIEAAQTDAKELCNRLITYGIRPQDIQVAFSGMKGFSVEVITDKKLSNKEFKNINLTLAEGLKTNDMKILDCARIFRIVGTRHDKSGLYKFPITVNQLFEMPVKEIMELAKDINNAPEITWDSVKLPEAIYALRESASDTVEEAEPEYFEANELNFQFKPKGFSNCKFAIMHGFFPAGTRNNALMALAATCRAQGYPKEIAYNMLKGAARLQGRRTSTEPFSKKEIWTKIIEVVYGSTWKGAQYTCKNQDWLRKEICEPLGKNKCNHSEVASGIIEINDMYEEFEKYSSDIEKNTIKTGIRSLDDRLKMTVGMPVALLGAPSSGKTSLALEILNNVSRNDVDAVFFSMDMYGPLVYLKQIQKLEGLSNDEIHHIFKHDARRKAEIKEKLREEYKNVRFSLKAGHTVQDMRDIISDYQDSTGRKVKLVLTDYLECISGPYSDATANSAKIAGELRDFATEMAVCGITLVQPPKSAGDASFPLDSMRQVKGSSMLEQSFRAILSIYREGFGPNNPERDKFLTIGCLKNTMGPLFKEDFLWNGKRGEIMELDEEGAEDLAALRKSKAAAKGDDGGFG